MTSRIEKLLAAIAVLLALNLAVSLAKRNEALPPVSFLASPAEAGGVVAASGPNQIAYATTSEDGLTLVVWRSDGQGYKPTKYSAR